MPKTAEFFEFQRGRGRTNRCGVCANPQAAQACRDILEAAVKSGRRVTLVALGEWLVKEFALEIRPKSVEGHIHNHEAKLWVKVRG